MSTETSHEIASLVARHAKDEGDSATAIDTLFLSRRSSRSPSNHIAQSPIFGMVVQGRKSIELGGKTQHYGVGDYLFVSIDVPVTSRVSEASVGKPLLGLGMLISPERLNEVLTRFDTPPRAEANEEVRSVIVARASANLLDATLRLLRLLETPVDIRSMAPLIEQEIIYRLLSGPYGGHLLQLAVVGSPGNRVAKATAWLREHYAQALRIAELAEHVGMSESSLHHHFKAIIRLTPMQYQKQFRLQEARRLIQIEQFDIGSAGYAVGYQSRSQFSREYSRLYGLSPRHDLKGASQR
jgi:AraC-like DNA-binding protein